MRIILLTATASLLFSPFAHADKFWLRSETPQEQAVEGSRPDVIDGVVLDQDDTTYHLRIAGGELWLPKAKVAKVETDGLTVAALEKQEADAAPRLADAEREREREQAMWLEASAQRQAQPREASFDRSEAQPALVPVQPAPVYDPVLDVAHEQMRDYTLLRDLELAYQLTNDHRYIKTLRVLRRLR